MKVKKKMSKEIFKDGLKGRAETRAAEAFLLSLLWDTAKGLSFKGGSEGALLVFSNASEVK